MNCRLRALPPAAGAIRTNNDMKIVIDRIEDEIAVCELENGEFVEAPLALFGEVKEGDIITLAVEEQQTEDIKEKMQNKLSALFARSEDDENCTD